MKQKLDKSTKKKRFLNYHIRNVIFINSSVDF